MFRLVFIAAAATVSAACVSDNAMRGVEYARGDRIGHVSVGGLRYFLKLHPDQNALSVEEAAGAALRRSFSVGPGDASPRLAVPRAAAAAYLTSFGCTPFDAYELDDWTTEVLFECNGAPPRPLEADLCVEAAAASLDWREPGRITGESCNR